MDSNDLPAAPLHGSETTSLQPSKDRPAWRSGRAWLVLLLVMVFGLALDLGTKSWSFHSVADHPVVIDRTALINNANYQPIPPHESVVLVPGRILNLHLVLNSGAVFGIGAEKRGFFIGFTLVALGVCFWIFTRWMSERSTMAHVGLGLVLAGALGNLWDRLIFGRVRDFLHLFPDRHLPFNWSWPGGNPELFPWVFNCADVMLLTGMGLLLIHLHMSDRRKKERQPADDTPAPAAS
ncbi:MAG: signal peptidase II [Planctomycetota bacterium]|nr:signal peptidase II [Planctomycetota bacterium]